MNTLHPSGGVGAFATPLVVAQIAVSTGEAHTVYSVFGAVMLLAALGLLAVPSPEVLADARPSANPAVIRRHVRVVALMGVLFFMHVGAGLALAIVGLVPGWGTWAGTALLGMSIASIFASCLNYMSSNMPTTSQITSVFLIAASLGSMTLPWLVGELLVVWAHRR